MKTQADMSTEDYVLVQLKKRGEFLWIVKIQLRKRAKLQTTSDDSSTEDILSQFVSAKEALNGQPSTIFRGNLDVVNLNNDYWQVSGSNANHGWGPFLYDIAMELAAEHNAWLCSDEDKVTDEACKVWEKYFTNRPDVEKQEMPSRTAWGCEYLKCGYRKDDRKIIEALRESKKIREHTEQCEESDDDTPEVELPKAE